jgi:hypothetical protein
MCTWGIDMATQHETPAMHSRAWSELGENPSGRSASRGAFLAGAAAAAMAGGFPFSASASSGIATRQNTPVPT